MAKIAETQGGKEWLEVLNKAYGVHNTRLNVSEEAFTAFLSEGITGPNKTIMVGRYCRNTMRGVIMDRRSTNREEGKMK